MNADQLIEQEFKFALGNAEGELIKARVRSNVMAAELQAVKAKIKELEDKLAPAPDQTAA